MKKHEKDVRKIQGLALITIKIIAIIIVALIIVISLSGCAAVRWINTGYENSVDYIDQKIDDVTNYDTKKKVEDTCRTMISSYESDKLTYDQYKDSDNEEKQSWAEQAKMRANKTASTYNNYILENSYIWSGNVPADIATELEYIE